MKSIKDAAQEFVDELYKPYGPGVHKTHKEMTLQNFLAGHDFALNRVLGLLRETAETSSDRADAKYYADWIETKMKEEDE